MVRFEGPDAQKALGASSSPTDGQGGDPDDISWVDVDAASPLTIPLDQDAAFVRAMK